MEGKRFGERTDPPRVETIASMNAPSWTAWIFGALSVALPGAVLLALLDAVWFRWDFLSLFTVRAWFELFCFSLISHAVLGLAACGTACFVGLVATRLFERSRRWFQPGPLAFAAWAIVQLILAAYSVAMFKGADPARVPGGTSGLGLALASWLVLLPPAGLVCSHLSRTLTGRILKGLAKWGVWPALALLMAGAGVAWHGRSRIQSAEGFWPMSDPPPSIHPTNQAPNILLVVFDTLRVDRLGCYGYERPTTPHIDAFAADAVVWNRAVSPAAWTVPSHASLFTGLHPSQHGADYCPLPEDDIRPLDNRFETLAELLANQGYETIALSNNDYVSPLTNLTQGFQRFAPPMLLRDSFRSLQFPFYVHVVHKAGVLGSVLGPWFARDPGGRATTRLAARCLGERDSSRPFFLFVNYMEAHIPYEPSLAYRRQFVKPEDRIRSYRIDQTDPGIWNYLFFDKTTTTEDDVRILSDLYDARVRELDDHFADLIRIVAGRASLDNTIIILTADHGENLGERGMLDHQYCVYNTLVHVPLIVRWPSLLKPQRVDRLVHTSSIFASVLEWVGAKIREPGGPSSRPLAASTRTGNEADPPPVYSEYLHWPAREIDYVRRHYPHFDASRWTVSYRAIFDGPWKLIKGSASRFELYNLSDDPDESHNLAAGNPSKVDQLAGRLERWVSTLEPFDPNSATGPRRPDLDPEQRRRLRDLGYVQ